MERRILYKKINENKRREFSFIFVYFLRIPLNRLRDTSVQ